MQEGKSSLLRLQSTNPNRKGPYEQIEKKLLDIVLGCKRVNQFVYTRHTTVESNYKPLEETAKKPMSDLPKRLQRMLLRHYDMI